MMMEGFCSGTIISLQRQQTVIWRVLLHHSSSEQPHAVLKHCIIVRFESAALMVAVYLTSLGINFFLGIITLNKPYQCTSFLLIIFEARQLCWLLVSYVCKLTLLCYKTNLDRLVATTSQSEFEVLNFMTSQNFVTPTLTNNMLRQVKNTVFFFVQCTRPAPKIPKMQ